MICRVVAFCRALLPIFLMGVKFSLRGTFYFISLKQLIMEVGDRYMALESAGADSNTIQVF